MKYLFYNDICYLKFKRNKIILVYFILPFISYFLLVNANMSTMQIILSCLGLNFNIKENSIFEIIIFITNISFFTFIIIDLFLKDICYQTDNIFLRMSPQKWIFLKIIYSFIIIFTIRLLQYMILCLLLNIDVKFLKDVFTLFINEVLYISFIQYSILSLILFFRKNKWIFFVYFCGIVIVLFVPKNIYSIVKERFTFPLSIATIITYICFIYYFIYRHKYIFSINKEE